MLSRIPFLVLLVASGALGALRASASSGEPAPESAADDPVSTPAAREGEPAEREDADPVDPAPAPPPAQEAPPAPPASTAPDASPAPPAPAAQDAPRATAPEANTAPAGRRVGDPVPLTLREPTLKAGSLMVGVRYGLVGSGPTRFVDDVRFSLTDTIELRTALYPWPASLTGRARFGSQQAESGAVLVEGGLAFFDAGIRIVPDSGETKVGARLHFEGSVGWAKSFADRFAVHGFAHYRYRLSFLPDDDQHAAAVDAHLSYDLLDALAVSAGVGFATTIGTPVREVVINFVETDRSGISHLLARDDGGEQSVTLPLTLTYGRVDAFDVDLFCTPRVWPELGILFGAGLRLRLEPLFKS